MRVLTEAQRLARNAQQRGYAAANRERRLARQRAAYQRDRAKILAAHAVYREANREAIRVRDREYLRRRPGVVFLYEVRSVFRRWRWEAYLLPARRASHLEAAWEAHDLWLESMDRPEV